MPLKLKNYMVLYVNGSSGQNFLLNTEQKKQVFKVAKEAVGDKVKSIAEVGSLDLNEAIELGKYATELGYDALFLPLTPFDHPFTFEEIRDYYFDIIEATQNNMIIYAIPDLTGVNISIPTIPASYLIMKKLLVLNIQRQTSSYLNVLEKHSQTN